MHEHTTAMTECAEALAGLTHDIALQLRGGTQPGADADLSWNAAVKAAATLVAAAHQQSFAETQPHAI